MQADSGKVCKDCGEYKDRSSFSRDKSKKNGMATYCKPCSLERYKSYYKVNGDKVRKTASEWYSNNKDKARKNQARWVADNRDRHLEIKRNSHKRHYKGGSSYRISHIMRANLSRLSKAIGGLPAASDSLGYTSEDLRLRMEVQFKDGMSWDNYGEWEIDHKIPMSIMIERGEVRPDKVSMLSNLQPMWAKENRSKGNRWVG